ncbi:MAG: hypothetical protein K6F23_01185 [Solobacterium sp.]|nr:hypothetical protein [Solobacterium sp.]
MTNNPNPENKKTDQKLSPIRMLNKWVNGEELPMEEKDFELHLDMKETNHPVLTVRDRARKFRKVYVVFSICICVALISIMMIATIQMPPFGEVDVPTNNEVSEKYIEDGLTDTGSANIVAGMILDYRAFDTLGESTVLFIAVNAVIILLKRDPDNPDLSEEAQDRREELIAQSKPNVILKIMASVLIPFILLYGAYVVLNGHISPGGGFSGGAIMGGALILFASSYGFKKVSTFFNFKTFTGITSTALLVYACSKAYSFFTGANHLESFIPKGIPGAILSGGLILPLNICVGMIVACTMYGFYSLFSRGDI